MKEVIDRMISCRRVGLSRNGNPTYDVTLKEHGVRRTSSDSGFCYGLENRENFEADLAITFTKSGRIRSLRLAD